MHRSIEQLCREYTDLTDEEIQVIEMMAATLQPLANLESADIFIDCRCREGADAIVVAEAKPEDAPSAYQDSVVSMLAKEENEPAVARTFRLGIATKYMKARTQEDNYTIQSVEPIKYNSRVIGVLIREKRITEDDEAEAEPAGGYEAVERPLEHMVNEGIWLSESLDEGLLLIDANGRVAFRNAFAKELFRNLGFVHEIKGRRYKDICLLNWDGLIPQKESLKEIQCGNYYLRIREIALQKGDIRLAVIIRDITWDRMQEKNLMLKSVAVKELHHRVKNNLQTIASLLRLQARRAEHEETKQVLEESISRILAISATHQLLSQNGETQVSLREILNTVKSNVIQPFTCRDFRLKLELLGEDITVDSDVAGSVALVTNELLQNSLKYAFTGRSEGTVTITIEKGKVYSTLTVKDDGVGFDEKQVRTGSLGLSLARTIVQDKLHGKLRIRSGKSGTSAEFDFVNEMTDFISVLE